MKKRILFEKEIFLSVRTYNCLHYGRFSLNNDHAHRPYISICNPIYTISDLVKLSPSGLLKLRNFGRVCLNEIVEELQKYKLSLKEDTPHKVISDEEIFEMLNSCP